MLRGATGVRENSSSLEIGVKGRPPVDEFDVLAIERVGEWTSFGERLFEDDAGEEDNGGRGKSREMPSRLRVTGLLDESESVVVDSGIVGDLVARRRASRPTCFSRPVNPIGRGRPLIRLLFLLEKPNDFGGRGATTAKLV